MTTFVGTQGNFADAIRALIELEYDARAAYELSIDKLHNAEHKQKMTEFKQDHERHISELKRVMSIHGENSPDGPDLKQYLTKGKVIIAQIFGDKHILEAMSSNEDDTIEAYEVINSRTDKWIDIAEIIQQALSDEKKHKNWITEQVKFLVEEN